VKTERFEISRREWDAITNAHLQRLAQEGWCISKAWSTKDGYVITFEREIRDASGSGG
jgi:hypothetical protein